MSRVPPGVVLMRVSLALSGVVQLASSYIHHWRQKLAILSARTSLAPHLPTNTYSLWGKKLASYNGPLLTWGWLRWVTVGWRSVQGALKVGFHNFIHSTTTFLNATGECVLCQRSTCPCMGFHQLEPNTVKQKTETRARRGGCPHHLYYKITSSLGPGFLVTTEDGLILRSLLKAFSLIYSPWLYFNWKKSNGFKQREREEY